MGHGKYLKPVNWIIYNMCIDIHHIIFHTYSQQYSWCIYVCIWIYIYIFIYVYAIGRTQSRWIISVYVIFFLVMNMFFWLISFCTYAVLAGPYYYGDRFYNPLPCCNLLSKHHHHAYNKYVQTSLYIRIYRCVFTYILYMLIYE
jgi:hypothetical protein